MMSLLELFSTVDNFWEVYEPLRRQQQLGGGQRQRQRAGKMSESEMMTLVGQVA